MQTKHPMCALGFAALGVVTATGHHAAMASTSATSAATSAAAAVGMGSLGANTIKRLDIAATQNATRIMVEGALPFTPDVRLLDRPSATVITVPGVWNEGRAGFTDVRRNGVNSVQTSALQDGTGHQQLRIVASTRSRLTWSVQGSPDRCRWEITLWKPGAGPLAADAATAAPSTPLFAPAAANADPDSDSLRSLMDRRAAAIRPASSLRMTGAPAQPLVISAVYLRKSASAPAETGTAESAIPSLRQAGLATTALTASGTHRPLKTVPAVPATVMTAAAAAPASAALPPLQEAGLAATAAHSVKPTGATLLATAIPTSVMASARTTAANPASLPSLRQAGIKTTLSVAAASGASLAAIEPSTAASARAAVPELHAVPLAHQSAKTPVTASSLRRFFPAAQSSVVITPMSAPTFATSDSEPTGRRVSLDFVDADISEVIKALAVQSGINVILATGGAPTGAIQNRITVSLHHVSFAEALDTVVNLSGYRYARIGSNYAVGTPEAVSALARGASTGPSVNDSIPFIFADGQSLLNSILSSFPNLRGRVTLISIGTEGRQGSSLYTVGQNSPASGGAPTGTNPTVPPGGPVQQQTGAPAPAGELDRVVPKGGVINISGTQAEIDAARALVEQTESALVDAPYQEQLRQSKRFAGLTNEVYKIKYASATELMAILARLVPNVYVTPGPSQAFSPKTTGQSVTFTGSAIPGLGGDAGGGGPVQNTSGPANSSITVTSATTTLILTGQPETLARARDVLDKVDIRLPQVVYEAKVVDINSQYGKKLGITYDPTRAVQIGEAQVGVSPIKDGATTGTPISMGPQASQDLARTPNFGAIYRTPYTVQMQLQAAVNDNKAKVLSNPNLTALDGQTATAFIGDQVKYITNITQTQQGQNVATETATVGITLKVTGRTSPDGTITLYVHPEVSSITSFLNAGNGIQLPQISTRFVDTTIRVKDGETIAIGGLISDTDSKNMQKVPVLGDIPFFGELFRFRQDQHNKDEVVVFITTHVNNN